jgi:hypothetical protein
VIFITEQVHDLNFLGDFLKQSISQLESGKSRICSRLSAFAFSALIRRKAAARIALIILLNGCIVQRSHFSKKIKFFIG